MTTAKPTQPDPSELKALIETMRFEVARELGLDAAHEGYFGELSSAQCGKYGQILYSRAKALLAAAPGALSNNKPRQAHQAKASAQAGARVSASTASTAGKPPRSGTSRQSTSKKGRRTSPG